MRKYAYRLDVNAFGLCSTVKGLASSRKSKIKMTNIQ